MANGKSACPASVTQTGAESLGGPTKKTPPADGEPVEKTQSVAQKATSKIQTSTNNNKGME